VAHKISKKSCGSRNTGQVLYAKVNLITLVAGAIMAYIKRIYYISVCITIYSIVFPSLIVLLCHIVKLIGLPDPYFTAVGYTLVTIYYLFQGPGVYLSAFIILYDQFNTNLNYIYLLLTLIVAVIYQLDTKRRKVMIVAKYTFIVVLPSEAYFLID